MAMTLVLDQTAQLFETLDDYDSQLFAFADHTRPALSKIADAYYDGGELSSDDARELLGELRELLVRLRGEGTECWPKDAPGPSFNPTTANIERFIATGERVCALLELAIERRATIWFDCD